jgi:hypothetical protein
MLFMNIIETILNSGVVSFSLSQMTLYPDANALNAAMHDSFLSSFAENVKTPLLLITHRDIMHSSQQINTNSII